MERVGEGNGVASVVGLGSALFIDQPVNPGAEEKPLSECLSVPAA